MSRSQSLLPLPGAGFVIAATCLCVTTLMGVQSMSAQVEPEPSYESRFVETRGIRLQYADFGGSGLPVVFVQNIHDVSLEERPEGAWLSRLADEFRVLAPVRRGYGESDDPGWGYDVVTQAEDLLGLMDALGIRRAVLVGGPPAPQEMMWIAEHHPERLAGLVFLANPHVEPDFREPEVRAFAENYWRGSCDLGETAVARIGPRAAWRPHFLEDETARIDVPALRFFWPGSTLRSMDLRRLDRVEQMAASEPACDGEAAAREYFAALAADGERLALLRHALTESDRSVAMDSGMARAFGSKLRTVVAGDLGGLEVEDFVYPHVRRFIEEIAGGETARPGSPAAVSDIVQVAPPTGERAADRASILAALERVRPGDTVQFAPGTYLLGGFIPVSVSGVTLLGHRNGTTLRGCDPAEPSAPDSRTRCNTLALVGSRQVVRNLTFEYMSWGLTVGFVIRGSREFVFHSGEGGHLIEGNTFRDSFNGVRAGGDWPSPVVVRGNRFVNTYHAGDVAGRRVHFLDNDISAPDPTRVATFRHVGGATQITPLAPAPGDVGLPAAVDCEENVIAGNRYDGHPDAIVMYISRKGSCRNNVIRDNTIIVRRARFFADRSPGPIRHETDSTLVGIPLVLADWSEEYSTESRGVIENNVIESNRIIGAEGLGIMLHRASRNRVTDNTITGIRRREPFPGNVLWGIDEEQWRHANGSAIWVSPGSDGNEIIGNTFEDVAGAAVVLEGDSNRVELRSAPDAVRDLGNGNRVGAPDRATAVPAYESKFIDAGGVRLHYLDFGGEGLPLVFVHSEGWDAYTYEDFAPRFTDRNRVLAVTRRGYGQSGGRGSGYDVPSQGESLIDLLDALGIERAVFAGNASATSELTYLAEHHPERVSGLVYFTGLATPWLEEDESDPTRAFEMYRRANPAEEHYEGQAADRARARSEYRPEFLRGDRPTITVPALAFVARSGTMGQKHGIGALALVGSPLMSEVRSQMPPSPAREYLDRLATDEAFRRQELEQIPDPVAREYFIDLASNEALQAAVQRYHEETIVPAVLSAQEQFRRAFGDNLRLVRLDVSQVMGYEYRDSPELIEPHIREFLAAGEPVTTSAPDTTRYTVIINGHPKAEWRMWQEDSDTWRYEYEGEEYDSYHFPRSERLVLDSDGLPVELEIMGQKSPWAAWEERFEGEGGVARWTTTVDEGERSVDGSARYYAALHPVHDRGVLVRALLRRSSGRLPLLPDGEARLEALGERSIATEKGTRTVRHYAVHGLDLKPVYVWLDESGATFADEWSVLSGWEAAFPELRAATEEALAEHHRGLARSVVPPARERPLTITGARLFDPETHGVRAGTTILIDGSRIAAVGPDGSVEAPPGAEVIEAAGRMVLPGLWDMHAHHGIPSVYLELDAPLHLAGGITTARDLGSHTEPILSLKERIEAGNAIGPRLLLAGFIEGAGGRPSGVLVGSAAEGEAAVDRFAELGFVQIKIYGQLPGELVPVVIERAADHGLRVSGHITDSMSGRDAVEAGYDEIQHIAGIMNGMLGSSAELRERVDDGWTGWSEALADLQPGSETVRELVELLVAHGVAIDPTLAGTEASDVPPDYVAPVLDRLPPQARRRILDRFWIPHPESLPHQDGIVSSGRGFVRVAHEAGVPVLPGTDIIPGFGYHRELELYVEAGIPAPEVLTLATLGAARVMGMDDKLGSIEPGKLADLILVDGDPTTDISDIRRVVTVIKDGTVYDPAAIYRALGIRPCCQPDASEVRR